MGEKRTYDTKHENDHFAVAGVYLFNSDGEKKFVEQLFDGLTGSHFEFYMAFNTSSRHFVKEVNPRAQELRRQDLMTLRLFLRIILNKSFTIFF